MLNIVYFKTSQTKVFEVLKSRELSLLEKVAKSRQMFHCQKFLAWNFKDLWRPFGVEKWCLSKVKSDFFLQMEHSTGYILFMYDAKFINSGAYTCEVIVDTTFDTLLFTKKMLVIGEHKKKT